MAVTSHINAPRWAQSLKDRVGARAGVLRFSCAHLLVALVLLVISAPFVEKLSFGTAVEAVLLTLVFLSGVLAVGGRRRTLIWAIVLVAPALTAKWAIHLNPNIAQEIFIGSGIVFVGFVAFHLFRFILTAPRVNSEVLCAGAATYITLALLWAFAYALLARLDPGAFVFSVPPPDQPMKGFTPIYFSFITLSTVGYGDITPATGSARMLAMTEAVSGTFYVAVVIARLVSLYSTAAPVEAKSNGSAT